MQANILWSKATLVFIMWRIISLLYHKTLRTIVLNSWSQPPQHILFKLCTKQYLSCNLTFIRHFKYHHIIKVSKILSQRVCCGGNFHEQVVLLVNFLKIKSYWVCFGFQDLLSTHSDATFKDANEKVLSIREKLSRKLEERPDQNHRIKVKTRKKRKEAAWWV